MSTVAKLKKALKDYRDDTPLLWQFYSSDHAFIPEDQFAEVAYRLMDNQVFLEDLHEFLSEWMELTLDQVKNGGKSDD
jgi:hypothetical protein